MSAPLPPPSAPAAPPPPPAASASGQAQGDASKEAYGEHVWHARRAAWTALSPSRVATSADGAAAAAPSEAPARRPRPPTIEPDAVYDDLLVTHDPFPTPIPLPEMVDFLVDTWIEDGLY